MNPALLEKSRVAYRLSYIDWMRGLACLLMFQTHCYDAWLGGTARQSRLLMYSQLGGTFPAPLFLFLAGISLAMVVEKLLQKKVDGASLSAAQIGAKTIGRGAEIFAFGLLFRMQEYLIAMGWAPKSDLLRVDILNTIGLSMMLMGILCWLVLAVQRGDRRRMALVLAAFGTAAFLSLVSPLLWTIWRPTWLPWPLESYVDGVHNLGVSQAGLFPVFPWTAFAFAGLAVGFILQSPWVRSREPRVFLSLGGIGIVLVEAARWLDAEPRQFYPVYDYWHTSPEFFLIRVGMLLMILSASYVWCRWGLAQTGFSPLIQLGQASLLVYWVHLEFVYGRFSILPRRAVGIGPASVGLLIIFLAMLLLAYGRTHMKGWIKNAGSKGTNETGPPVLLAGGHR